MKIISVVRDFEMYDRLVRNNPFNKGADFSCLTIGRKILAFLPDIISF